MACLCASHVARGLAEGYALMAPDSIRGGASSWGPLARPWGSLDDEPSVWEFSRSIALSYRASEVLGRFPGPFRTVTLVDISPDLFDGPLDALPSQFPCLRALRVVDHGVYRRPECALELARAVRRMASLRDLRWTNPPECVLREFAGFRGLREAVVFLPEGSNAWMARVPGLLGGVEALEVVAFRVVCLDSSLRRPNICQLMADLLSACWHLETLELRCATHNKSVRALANVYDSAGASLRSGACSVSLELLPGGYITPEAMPQCRGLLRSLSEIKGTCSTLQVVAPLCSQQLKEVWILDDDETGRSDSAAEVADVVRRLPRSCMVVHASNATQGCRLRYGGLLSGVYVCWEMPV
eukprot:m51a1_g13533 hypothetical protein (356) ;mRNA; r:643-1962